MIHNMLILVAITGASMILSGAYGLIENKGWKGFDWWWNSKGIPIAIIVSLVLAIIVTARGCWAHQ